MWTDSIGLENAAPTQTVTVRANETRVLRAYVLLPSGATASAFAFRLTAQDEQRESDTAETTFAMPGAE